MDIGSCCVVTKWFILAGYLHVGPNSAKFGRPRKSFIREKFDDFKNVIYVQ
jgi:hypothetical protein